LKVVCLGDSITYGYKLADPSRDSYPARLQRQAQGSWQVVNLGFNGATVLKKGDIPLTGQSVYTRALRSRPDVVVLLLGTNDVKDVNWRYLHEFEHDYESLLFSLQNLPTHPHVIACSIPPILIDYPNGLNRKRQQKINSLINSVVSRTGIDFLDLFSALAENKSLFVDGIHPNSAGATRIANLVFDKITSL
jgi:sialate O-acetylesterase